MKRALALLLTLLALLAGPAVRAQDLSVRVPLVQLLANPSAFDGQQVMTTGYLNLEFEGNQLYLHREDYENFTGNALWVDPPPLDYAGRARISHHYVLIVGTVDASRHGHVGASAAALTNVTRLEPALTRTEVATFYDPHPWLWLKFTGGLAALALLLVVPAFPRRAHLAEVYARTAIGLSLAFGMAVCTVSAVKLIPKSMDFGGDALIGAFMIVFAVALTAVVSLALFFLRRRRGPWLAAAPFALASASFGLFLMPYG